MTYSNIPTAPNGLELTDIIKYSAQFPGLTAEGGALRVHYQKFMNRHDTLETGTLENGKLMGIETISGTGDVLYPVGLNVKGTAWYAWSEAKGGKWKLHARCTVNGKWSDTITADEGDAVLYPDLFVWKDTLYLLWTRQERGKAAAVLCRLTENGAEDVQIISSVNEAYRASGCEGGDGNLYVAYDAYLDGAYHTVARAYTGKGWTDERILDETEEWASGSKIIPSKTGATVCWYGFGYGATFSVNSADIHVSGDHLEADAPQVLTSNVGWYLDMDAAGRNSDGMQVIAYTWSKDATQVRYRKAGGKWSDPAMMSFEDIHCCEHPSLLLTDGDQILLAWQFSHRNGHYDRNSSVILTAFTPEDIDKRGDPSKEAATNNFTIPIKAEKHLDKHPDETVEKWLRDNGYSGKLLFGDIHGQSNISDGMGYIDQYYHRCKGLADLQFSSLTDHDSYPDWISQSEWELMRSTARLMNTDNDLTILLSYEWTPNEYQYDFGHKNVYYRDDNGDLFRSSEPCGITPTDLYASLKHYRGICIPHHPAADWGSVSAATDWSFHDDKVERLVEIMSRHAPYEDYESSSKYTKNIKKMKYHCVQDALAKGHRMGFTAGSDSHQMEHGVEGGIVAVFTPTHDREGIWDALYDRRSYGTTGARILVSFKVNGHMMGSELTLKQGDTAHFEISIFGTKPVKVDLIRNNQVLQTWEPGCERCDVSLDECGTGASDFYYVRVTQPDDHMAWSSPIWIDRV